MANCMQMLIITIMEYMYYSFRKCQARGGEEKAKEFYRKNK